MGIYQRSNNKTNNDTTVVAIVLHIISIVKFKQLNNYNRTMSVCQRSNNRSNSRTTIVAIVLYIVLTMTSQYVIVYSYKSFFSICQ